MTAATGATDRAAKSSSTPSLPDPLRPRAAASAARGRDLPARGVPRAVGLRVAARPRRPPPSCDPGTDRLVLFHLVASGTCWVQVGDEEKHWASAGDVIVLPYGDQHRMGGVGESESVPLMTIMEAPPWTRMPLIRHGRDGALTDVVCGFLHSDDVLFDPALRVFPPAFVVRPPGLGRRRLGARQHRLRARPGRGLAARARADQHPAAGDAARRGAPPAPGHGPGGRPRLARGPARPGPQPGPGGDARGPGAQVDRHRPGAGRGRVALGPRRAVPPGPRPLTHPLPHRVADAPRRGPPDLHRPRGRRRSPAASGTTPRRRSAGRSSATAARRPRSGGRSTTSGPRPE